MNFCPNCGGKIDIENAKFCSNCGFNFQEKKVCEDPHAQMKSENFETEYAPLQIVNEEETEESKYTASNAYHLGYKFEEMVEQIFKAKGYDTQRRIKIKGSTDTPEFDIIAKKKRKGKEIITAIECKNYSNTIPPDLIRTFIFKLDDTGIPNGLFVAIPDFSSGAKSLGENKGLELWDEETVKEKFFQLKVGRLNVGDKVDFKYYLPAKIDYNYAANLDFENKNKVEISGVKLIWRPFYKVFYELNSVQTDPIKNKCTECGEAICDACLQRCPICGEDHCNKHMTKCAKCGKEICTSCTRKEGSLIFKKTICKDC